MTDKSIPEQKDSHKTAKNIIFIITHILVIILILTSFVLISNYFKTEERLHAIEAKLDLMIEAQNRDARVAREFTRDLIYNSTYQIITATQSTIPPALEQPYSGFDPGGSFELSTPQTEEQLLKAIVSVYAGEAIGSGFIVTEDGGIITKNAILQGQSRAEADFYTGTIAVAYVTKRDIENDLALIRVNGKNLNTLNIDQSPNLTIGQKIAVLGHPKGKDIMLSIGTITDINQDSFLFSSAEVDAGNHGGPVIDSTGKVIGIVISSNDGTHTAILPKAAINLI